MNDRVLVWAAARDGGLTCGFLTEIGLTCVQCERWEEFRAELDAGVGAVVVGGELLSHSVFANLKAILALQPPWSDLPIIVVAGTEPPLDGGPLMTLGNVSVLQRPVSLDTLRSAVGAALRARQRQYEIRDLLHQRDEADAERVFELFGQGASSLDRGHGGLGIGLTVVRLLADLHGGSAQVFSDGEGTGTEALIELPLHSGRVVQGPARNAHLPSRGPANRVLLIEDNHDVADMLAVYLQQIGHEVIQAHDGQSGLDAAVRHQPAVVVCDIGLPGLDGYEIARRVRDIPDLHACLLIAVSGYGERTDRERARTAGFSHHITKPADPALLADLIANSTERHY